MEFLNVLSREEMKNVKGGHGGCHAYCCTGGPGTCVETGSCTGCSSTNNEDCQTELAGLGFTCAEGEYLASLYYPQEA
tara:strand:+ start:5091 stop:5324 length:234 start_codon:yes stop_codon:yes gene_type:complete